MIHKLASHTPEALLETIPPDDQVDVVLDSDTYNEIDDQYALVYALFSEKINVEAIYAAPFSDALAEDVRDASTPAEGMELSYEEIHRLLDRLDISRSDFVFRGSDSYLQSPDEPVESEAIDNLVRIAQQDRPEPLFVVAIGAPTNVVSALLTEPSIAEEIVVVWLGGDSIPWPQTNQFNLAQDIYASQYLFDCDVPLVHIPTRPVSEKLKTTVPELERHVKNHGEIGNFLFSRFAEYEEKYRSDKTNSTYSKEIWDISAVAYLIDPDWVQTTLIHSPRITSDADRSPDSSRHFVREAKNLDRDRVFNDFFEKLEANTEHVNYGPE